MLPPPNSTYCSFCGGYYIYKENNTDNSCKWIIRISEGLLRFPRFADAIKWAKEQNKSNDLLLAESQQTLRNAIRNILQAAEEWPTDNLKSEFRELYSQAKNLADRLNNIANEILQTENQERKNAITKS